MAAGLEATSTRSRGGVAQSIQPGDVVFDVGAHVGYYTLLAAIHTGPKGKVYAFEPVPRNLAFLRKHLALNRIGNAEVVEAAVSSAAGLVRFDEMPSSSMGHISNSGGLEVHAVTLDQLCLGRKDARPSGGQD